MLRGKGVKETDCLYRQSSCFNLCLNLNQHSLSSSTGLGSYYYGHNLLTVVTQRQAM